MAGPPLGILIQLVWDITQASVLGKRTLLMILLCSQVDYRMSLALLHCGRSGGFRDE